MKYFRISIWIILFVGIIVVCAYFLIPRENISYVTYTAKRADLERTVSETGMIKSDDAVEMSFSSSGNIESVAVASGDEVNQGDVLIALDRSTLYLQEAQAQANLKAAQANLNKALSPASASDIQVANAAVEKALADQASALKEHNAVLNIFTESIKQAQKNLDDLLSDDTSNITAYEQSIDTADLNLLNLKNKLSLILDTSRSDALSGGEIKTALISPAIDQINLILNDQDGKDLISAKNLTYLDKTKSDKELALGLKVKAEADLALAKLNSLDDEKINAALASILVALNKTFDALQNCYSALENSLDSINFTPSEISAYKTAISTQTSNISSAITAVRGYSQSIETANLNYDNQVSQAQKELDNASNNFEQAIKSMRDNLSSAQLSGVRDLEIVNSRVSATEENYKSAQANLNKVKSGSLPSEIAYARSQVDQVQASVELIQKQIEERILNAPFDGIITEVNYKVGEQVLSGKPAIKIIGKNKFKVEVLVAETEIAKVKVGQAALITVDAFGEDMKFKGEVLTVDPANTTVDNAVYYKVNIGFLDNVEEFGMKQGMTANAIIAAAIKEGVIIIPSRAVSDDEEGKKFIRIWQDGQAVKKIVEVGLRGDGGEVEAISGVNEGDEVIIYENKK